MDDVTLSVPVEQYERLAALAEARGLSVDTQLARLIDDEYTGADASADTVDLPLGVCEGDENAK